MLVIEVTAADDRGVYYNLGGDCCNFGGGNCYFGGVIAVFAKDKGPKFEIFFQKFKRGTFFSLLADFSYNTKR